MIKKIIIASTSIGLISSLQATEITSSSYAGAYAGFNHSKYEANNTIVFSAASGDALASTSNQPLNASNSKSGFSFGGFIGYTHILNNNIVIGLELAFGKNTGEATLKSRSAQNFNPNPGEINNTFNTSILSQTFNFTPSLFLGYKFKPNLVAGVRLGAHVSRFNINNTFIALDDVDFPQFVPKTDKTFTKTGFEFGLRGEYAITNSISMIADASYTVFSNSDVSLSNPSIQDNGNPLHANTDATHTVSVKPRFITARLGAVYRF